MPSNAEHIPRIGNIYIIYINIYLNEIENYFYFYQLSTEKKICPEMKHLLRTEYFLLSTR